MCSPSPRGHPRQHSPNAVQRSLAIDPDGALPLILAQVRHQRVVHHPSTVDENLDRLEFFFRPRHERPN